MKTEVTYGPCVDDNKTFFMQTRTEMTAEEALAMGLFITGNFSPVVIGMQNVLEKPTEKLGIIPE